MFQLLEHLSEFVILFTLFTFVKIIKTISILQFIVEKKFTLLVFDQGQITLPIFFNIASN